MKMLDIIKKVKSLAENDQSISNADVTGWVDDAINRINVALKSNIPTTGGNTTDFVPSFDERFHESLVIFCVAKYRESDADYQAGQYFMDKFNDMVLTMQRDMNLLPSTRVDNQVQQIVVSDIHKLVYSLKMDYGSYFDNVEVYKNDELMDNKGYRINLGQRSITFFSSITQGDKITIIFENNSDLNQPPYQWWNF